MILNVKIPFSYIQVKINTNSTEILNPIEFLWMNLINSKDKNEIDKDKTIKDCFKEYYNIDNKFFSFFKKHLEKLIFYDSIIVEGNKNNYDELLIGDFSLNESLSKNFDNNEYLSFREGIRNTYNCHNYFWIFSLGSSVDINSNLLESKNGEKIDFKILNINNKKIDNKNKAIANSKLFINENKLDKNEYISKSMITVFDEYYLINVPIKIDIDNNLVCHYKDDNAHSILSVISNNESDIVKENFIKSFDEYIIDTFSFNFDFLDNKKSNCIELDENKIKDLIDLNKLISDILGEKNNFSFYKNELCMFGIEKKSIKIQILDTSYFIDDIPFVCFSESIKKNLDLKENFESILIDSVEKELFNWKLFIENKDKFSFFEEKLNDILLNVIRNKEIRFFEKNNIALDYLSSNSEFVNSFYKNIDFRKLELYFDIKSKYKNDFFTKLFKLDQHEKKFLNDIKEYTTNDLQFEKFIWENYNCNFDINKNIFSSSPGYDWVLNFYKKLEKLEKDISIFIDKKENNFDVKSDLNNIKSNIKDLRNDFDKYSSQYLYLNQEKSLNKKFNDLVENWYKSQDSLKEDIESLSVEIRKEIEKFLSKNSNFNFKANNFKEALKQLDTSEDNKKIINYLKKATNEEVHHNENDNDFDKKLEKLKALKYYYNKFKNVLKDWDKKGK